MRSPEQRSESGNAASGTLQTVDGRHLLRFERRLAHSPERVWRAITEPDQLEKWFPAAVDVDLVTGGKMVFTFREKDVDSPDGQVTELDPPRVFAFDWGHENLRFELRPEGQGCVLVFTHRFEDRSGAARFAAGWHLCLDVLEAELDGRQTPWAPGDRWNELYGGIYETAFN
jgi:uncharacterized protein YndB with AHSA1/START domain